MSGFDSNWTGRRYVIPSVEGIGTVTSVVGVGLINAVILALMIFLYLYGVVNRWWIALLVYAAVSLPLSFFILRLSGRLSRDKDRRRFLIDQVEALKSPKPDVRRLAKLRILSRYPDASITQEIRLTELVVRQSEKLVDGTPQEQEKASRLLAGAIRQIGQLYPGSRLDKYAKSSFSKYLLRSVGSDREALAEIADLGGPEGDLARSKLDQQDFENRFQGNVSAAFEGLRLFRDSLKEEKYTQKLKSEAIEKFLEVYKPFVSELRKKYELLGPEAQDLQKKSVEEIEFALRDYQDRLPRVKQREKSMRVLGLEEK